MSENGPSVSGPGVPAAAPTGVIRRLPSKANFPPELPTASDLYVQSAENGQVIPIVYGTARVSGNIIERMPPLQLKAQADVADMAYWTAYTAKTVGQIVYVNESPRFYICTTAGTTGATFPGGSGVGITDGSCQWAFLGTQQGYIQRLAIAFCEGQIAGAGKAWWDKNSTGTYAFDDTGHGLSRVLSWMTLNTGTTTQIRPSWTSGWGYSDVYGNTAVLFWEVFSGTSNNAPNLSLEIKGLYSSGTDANPADIVTDIVSHSRRGAGWSSSRLFAASLDTSAASWRTYCTAAGLNVSMVIDSQSGALDPIATLLDVTQTDCVTSGGQLRFVPRCDQSITANGVTFTPSVAPVYDLGPDDLLDPLDVQRVSSTDTFNSCPVEYYDRSMDYGQVVVDDPDMSDVERRGVKAAGAYSTKVVMSQGAAVALSRTLAQRSLNVRNTYSVRLPGWRFCLLEPTDTLTVTDPVLAITRQPIRITAIEEDLSADGTSVLTVTAEDYPAAAHYAAQYATQAGDGYKPSSANAFDGIVVGSTQVGTGALPVDALTQSATDNLWPNPTSEMDPPPGANTSTPEWAYRYQPTISPYAYAGSWVRGLSGTTSYKTLDLTVPCSPGDAFYIEAQAAAFSGGGAPEAYVQIDFLDASGANTGEYVSAKRTTGSWGLVSVSGAGGAGTVTAQLRLVLHTSNALDSAQFDAVYARRMIAGSVVGASQIGSGHIVDGAVTPSKQGFAKHYTASMADTAGYADVTIDTQPDTTYLVTVQDTQWLTAKHTIVSATVKSTGSVRIYRQSIDGLGSTSLVTVDVFVARLS